MLIRKEKSMAYIEFKNVVKEYTMGDNKIRALDNANFEINKGELVVIVGPTGVGKTKMSVELAKRISKPIDKCKIKVSNPNDAANILMADLKLEKREIVKVIIIIKS